MNQKLTLFFIAGLIISGCKNNINEIDGKLLNSIKGEYIFLDELRSNELLTVDSVPVSDDGSFSLNLKINHPSFYLIKTDNSNFLTMLLEPGDKVEITAYHDSLNYPVSLSGSKGTELMAAYNKRLRETIGKLSSLREIYIRNLDKPELPLVMERLDSMAQVYLNEINNYTKKYIDDNISSLVSLVALYQQVAPGEYILHPQKDLKYYIKVDSSMWKLYPDYEPVISLHEQVAEMVSLAREQNDFYVIPFGGSIAPEVALPNPQGDTIRLSSTRGSVVLLDIWAAWCIPCRRENPNLVKAYDLYHSKGFEIYQVSIDKTREAWLKGIKEDNLDRWIHVSDLKYWSSMVVPLFKIESIPANFLLDREGRIIATNLRGEMLQQKLAEIFND
jgi:peroxiredoxin